MAKKGTGLDQPPERPAPQVGNKLDAQRASTELVQASHRLPRDLVTYIRMLSIQTGREQRDLIAEALTDLKKKHGDI